MQTEKIIKFTESVNSREEAYYDGESDKVNPCFIIKKNRDRLGKLPVRCNGRKSHMPIARASLLVKQQLR